MWTTGPVASCTDAAADGATDAVHGQSLQAHRLNFPCDVQAWAQGFLQPGAGPHGQDYDLIASALTDLPSWPKPGFLVTTNVLGEQAAYPCDDGFSLPICVRQLTQGQWAATRHGDAPVAAHPGDDFLQAVLQALARSQDPAAAP